MEWRPAYVCPCVTATATAILEEGRKLTATVRAYSEINFYLDKIFTEFERRYITPSMTTKEKAEKAAGYINAISDHKITLTWTFSVSKGGKNSGLFFRRICCCPYGGTAGNKVKEQ